MPGAALAASSLPRLHGLLASHFPTKSVGTPRGRRGGTGGQPRGPAEGPREAAGTGQGARPPSARSGSTLGSPCQGRPCSLLVVRHVLRPSSAWLLLTLQPQRTCPSLERSALSVPGRRPPPPPLLLSPLALCLLPKSSRPEMGLFPCLRSAPRPRQLECKHRAAGALVFFLISRPQVLA